MVEMFIYGENFMRLFKITILTIALIAMTYSAYCANAPEAVTQVDGEIASDIRNAIHAINNTLCRSMQDNRPGVMMNMFVEEGRNDPNLEASVRSTYEQLGQLAKGTPFNMFHEYLIDVKGAGVAMVTLPGDNGNKFNMSVEGGKGSIFVSLLTSSGNFKDLVLCFVYLKTKEGWQLFNFNCGVYKVDGKSPIQWYEEARKMYDKGWIVPAMQMMQLVKSFVRPAPFIAYDKEKEMFDFFKAGGTEAAKRYKFPFKAAWVKNAPVICGLDIEFVQNKLAPVVIYVTKYPLARGVPIQEEVDAINSKIEKVIPGITQMTDLVVYRAFTEPPLDQNKDYKYRTVPSKVRK